jgi:hypothetical protein
MDKLQRYFLSQVRDRNKDVIRSRSTKSMYFCFDGHIVRISDHLPTDFSRFETSIIWTSDPDRYVLLRNRNGQVETISYARAKTIAQSLSFLAPTLFSQPLNKATFVTEKEFYDNNEWSECIMGIPKGKFTDGQLHAIKKMIQKVTKAK